MHEISDEYIETKEAPILLVPISTYNKYQESFLEKKLIIVFSWVAVSEIFKVQ